jgi:CcmD family protein
VTSGEKYVAAVYGVVFLFVLAYVLIMATKLARLQREVGELARLVRSRLQVETEAPEQEEVAVG